MPDDLSAVLRPIGAANGLPNAHYTDPSTHEAERDALLWGGWAGIGVGADVPDPGDAKPLEFLGLPLLMLRGRDGVLRVFRNTCRHRGMILVDAPRKIEGAIRCPYHSWCYAHDGRLVATPHVGGPGVNRAEGIVNDDLGLVEVASHVWRDVVFVDVSGEAGPFEQAHAELQARWSAVDAPVFHGGADSRFVLEVACNWKLAVENYCESYHLPWVHPGLNSYSRLEEHYHIEAERFAGQGSTLYRRITGEGGETFPDFPGWPESWKEGAEYISVFPNVLMGAQRDHAFVIVLEPTGLATTREHVHLYYAAPETDGGLRAKNCAQWREVFEEDVFVVEGMQRGRVGPGFDGGRFSPAMDGPTHRFHQWVAAGLTERKGR
ncbi:aromatic ring-hydroxylating oxygenase subunit alpha [Vannielia litorea]|uniref:aromatic ring-hydroxylating oxygenase subunit alpha n=1 Tax=Vannielia litorea TaxID=1217970 RepID=UPI001C93CED9|nr:SRPBCC family protein [Vannielia litorea]MBY6049689.1 Rieske 2Fe-2S domain-containing protein [Vannielia litorea]MBY6077103.1 Rieske 2Fe-2S domain-containing protein [Vannielia litorea]